MLMLSYNIAGFKRNIFTAFGCQKRSPKSSITPLSPAPLWLRGTVLANDVQPFLTPLSVKIVLSIFKDKR